MPSLCIVGDFERREERRRNLVVVAVVDVVVGGISWTLISTLVCLRVR